MFSLVFRLFSLKSDLESLETVQDTRRIKMIMIDDDDD